MELIYEGVNITDDVDIRKAVHRDVSSGRCDALELELEHAATWYRWAPEVNDRIELIRDGYSTGALYLNSVLPEGEVYRILATSVPGGATRRAWTSYENKTLGELMALCGAECGVEAKLYGISDGLSYPYLLRREEGGAAFLNRLLEMEGGVLKTLQGRFAGIGVEYAQELASAQTININDWQANVRYRRQEREKYARLTVKSPYAEATATDSGTDGANTRIITSLPAMDSAQAGRWARGLLLNHNRRAEELFIDMEFNCGLSAMARVDIEGNTDATGKWLVDEVEHDFINNRSAARMLRCITTIK